MFVDIHTHHESSSPSNLINILNLSIKSDFNIEKNSFSKASAGIHPWYIEIENLEMQFQKLEDCLRLENVIILGECGLDRIKGHDFEIQMAIFIRQIQLAEKLKIPVIVHCVKSYNEVIKIKQKYTVSVPIIIHGFNKKPELAMELIEFGFYLSFGKAILESKTSQNAIKRVPFEKLFLETDDSEINIETIYLKAAALRNESMEDLKANIFNNYKKILK